MTSALYIVARTVLLDALEALSAQHDAIVLVGAQAIYLHTGDADIAVPAFTADGDLLIEAVAGAGRRAARLGDHGDRAGRRARGLEGALVDSPIAARNPR